MSKIIPDEFQQMVCEAYSAIEKSGGIKKVDCIFIVAKKGKLITKIENLLKDESFRSAYGS